MKKITQPLLAALLYLFTASSVLAADTLKIGVVDLQKVMQKSSQVAAVNSQLEKQFKPKQQAIVNASKTVREEIEKLDRNSAVMSEGDRTKLHNKIIADKANLQSSEISFQQEVKAAQEREMQKIMKKLKEVIEQVAKNGGYSLIMVKQGVPYVNENLDVTDAVIKTLEKR
jgi:outer membrane protein